MSQSNEQHDERRHYSLQCECGYQARDKRDMQEHVDTATMLAARLQRVRS